MAVIPTEYNLASLLNDLVNMVSFKVEEKQLELQVSVNKDIPVNLIGDEIRVKQIITNLLSNAVKYTDTGSISLKIDFRFPPRSESTNDDSIILIVAVSDTGRGIRKQDMSRLFESFQRLEENKNHYVEGTGLGMSITTKLLQLMDGNLQVDSTYGRRSTLLLRLLLF